MPNISPQLQAEIDALFPVLVEWAERVETEALKEGVPLNEHFKNTARAVRVRQPDAVRVLSVQSIPEPANRRIAELAARFGLSFAGSAGMTLGHAILVRYSHTNDERVITHELVHVGQYEEAGNIEAYLKVYVEQIIASDYQTMAFEVEAINETNRILGPPRIY
jgi:hypothetical protein